MWEVNREIIKELRVNERIKGTEFRLVGEKGEQLGVMLLYQAREVAIKHNLDLVEVAPAAKPPVCRLMDYGKYKYEQTRKEREARKTQKLSLLREVRLRPKIGEHDFISKERSVKRFLEDGDKDKVTIMFRGRENAHPELGLRLLDRVSESFKEVAMVEKQPTRERARLHIILSPQTTQKNKIKEEIKQKQDAKA
ncbi:MAG: translation initiation factor IF-3 [Dehalococcoidales bacterium]|nr:translation initiation factor IF-3 [Dehalococcoidales bacterium]